MRLPSGIIIPKPKPEPPPKPPKLRRGPTELQDEEKRALAIEALNTLWDAMSLSDMGGIHLPGSPSRELAEVYYRGYRFVGELLLGDDCPEHEVPT